jgi:transposase-like protein
MSLKKLTEEDKQSILQLYRHSPETTSTLAERFGVSSSTVSRFLKNSLSEQEYDDLIQQKRLGRATKADSQLALSLEASRSEASPSSLHKAGDKPPLLIRARKRKSSAGEEVDAPAIAVISPPDTVTADVVPTTESAELSPASLNLAQSETPEPSWTASLPMTDFSDFSEDFPVNMPPTRTTLGQEKPILKTSPLSPRLEPDLGAIAKDIDEDLADLDEEDELAELAELEDLEDLEEEEDEPLTDEEWEERANFLPAFVVGEALQVLPLGSAVFPKSCYLVIDRTSELIVRPLKEFAHLGTIPSEETQQRTLPVFDNQQVARRFSQRNQRVLKVPDSRLLQKTLSHLKAKGITRIFLDGQVYSLDLT